MPPRRAPSKEKAPVGRGIKKARISPNGHQLPPPIPNGEILTDAVKKQWRLGHSIGVGGFGEIYTASNDASKSVPADAPYVIKLEPQMNGPLYVEMHFYHRVAKPELIEAWKAKKKFKFLGMPRFISSGTHTYKKENYRFMVMERFGDDVQKLFEANKKKFSLKTVLTLSLKIIDILEYIHDAGYVHADIKGSNLLLGYGLNKIDEVYLVDFGLASLYMCEGKHKEYREDPRTAHNGTIEYTSRDAHIGVTSRRGDLEILGFNIVQWLCGKLPWEDNLKDMKAVMNLKNMYMGNIPKFMNTCFKTKHPEGVEEFLKYVADVKFEQHPDYSKCRKIFQNGLKKAGLTNDGKLEILPKASPLNSRKGRRRSEDDENESETSPKQKRTTPRKPCGTADPNRVRKTSPKSRPKSDSTPDSIPTPAMLEVIKMKEEKNKALDKQQRPTRSPKKKLVSSKGTATNSDTLCDTKSKPIKRSSRKRTSSFSPELF